MEADPETNLGIVRISPDGQAAELLWGYRDGGKFTSEFPAHLLSHVAWHTLYRSRKLRLIYQKLSVFLRRRAGKIRCGEQVPPVSAESEQQNQTENPAGNHFAEGDCDGGKPDGAYAISVFQNRRNHNPICDDGRERGQPGEQVRPLCAAGRIGRAQGEGAGSGFGEPPGAQGAYQRGQRPENDIRKSAAGSDISQQTANIQARNGSRSKKGKDGESFGEANLNAAAGQPQSVGDQREHDVESGDHRRLSEVQNIFVFHFLSPLVLFYVWKVSNTRFI